MVELQAIRICDVKPTSGGDIWTTLQIRRTDSKEIPKVEMNMARFSVASGNRVYIEIEYVRNRSRFAREHYPKFLVSFADRGLNKVDVPCLSVAARLKPTLKLPMSNHGKLLRQGRNNEGTTDSVPWLVEPTIERISSGVQPRAKSLLMPTFKAIEWPMLINCGAEGINGYRAVMWLYHTSSVYKRYRPLHGSPAAVAGNTDGCRGQGERQPVGSRSSLWSLALILSGSFNLSECLSELLYPLKGLSLNKIVRLSDERLRQIKKVIDTFLSKPADGKLRAGLLPVKPELVKSRRDRLARRHVSRPRAREPEEPI
jgi:hypothetical protein